MANNHIARRQHRWGGGATLSGAALATAALIGIGVTQAGGPTPVHRLSNLVHLLAAPSADGPDAFTIGPYTFDPATALPLCVLTACVGGTEGWSTFPPSVFPGPPLLNISGGELDGIGLATQDFVVYNSSGTVIGSIDTNGTIIQIAGQPSYEFDVTSSTSVAGGALPANGTIYDIFNFNLLPKFIVPPFTNVYEADPGGAVHDFMVIDGHAYNIANPVPLGGGAELNLSSLLSQNFTGNLSPGDAFSNLVATSNDSSIGSQAFTINVPGFDYTLDPFDTSLTPDTYTAVAPLASFAPILAAGGVNLSGIPAITQGFNVYDGTTNVGSFDATEFVTQFLGMTTTEEVVTSVTPHLGYTDADLPAVGTVFSVTNQTPFGLGQKDTVYIATPASGSTPSSATISTVTPSGTDTTPAPFNVDSAGNAEINPSDVFATLAAEQAYQNASIPPPGALHGGPSTPPTDAFTINGTTFYPETSSFTEGYNNIAQTSGGAPLMAVFGGGASVAGINVPLASQDFFYYDGTGANATVEGGIATNIAVTYLLFFKNAALTVTGCATLTCTDMPAKGTVFDVLNLGFGVENIYEGTPSGTVFDEIVTPLGPLFNIQLLLPPSMDAGVPFTPADIVPSGLDVPF